eukprot:NODE_485_length_1350_cov_271.223674_g351_i0.p1 GENE.NODE_485_length_1350_cov_271.223674_g351_i0~~NODE_485_length_1350_cov_271.223674_g351_i0.p1  ORF type:complete len:314 (+),score=102.94 NODE_485_length_1350_cov_271.223674_g351_i0:106-1047(+)
MNRGRPFCDDNIDPSQSYNYHSGIKDDLSYLSNALNHTTYLDNRSLLLCIVRTLKVLSRKSVNRATIAPAEIAPVCGLLHVFGAKDAELAADICNFILNICYHQPNIRHALDAVPWLVECLDGDDDYLHVAAAGALQGICISEDGKRSVLNAQAIPKLVALLQTSPNLRVSTRCVGTMHNLSTEWPGVAQIRDNNAIPLLIALLDPKYTTDIRRHAAAVLQNLSRDKECLPTIRSLGAVEPLSQLRFQEDLHTQISATGALLNINGQAGDQSEERKAFKKALTQSLVVGMLSSMLEETMSLNDLPVLTAEEDA